MLGGGSMLSMSTVVRLSWCVLLLSGVACGGSTEEIPAPEPAASDSGVSLAIDASDASDASDADSCAPAHVVGCPGGLYPAACISDAGRAGCMLESTGWCCQ